MIKTVTLLVALGMTAVASAAEEPVDKIMKQGDKAYGLFKNVEALAFYRQAYKLAPDRYDVLSKLTAACNNVGEEAQNKQKQEKYFKQAIIYATELVKKHPREAEAYFYLAITNGNLSLYRSGRGKAEAGRNIEKYARKCIELDPDFSPGYVTLGIYYREVSQMNWFMKALAKTLGGGLPSGTIEMSEDMLRTAVKKAPDVIYPRYQLAVTLELAGKKAEAVKHYRKVIELQVTDHQDLEKKRISAKKIKELTSGK